MMTPHDKELYDQALKVKRGWYLELEELASQCLSEEGRTAINNIITRITTYGTRHFKFHQ